MISPDVAKRPWLVRLAPVREWWPVSGARDETHEEDVQVLDREILVVEPWQLSLDNVLLELVPPWVVDLER